MSNEALSPGLHDTPDLFPFLSALPALSGQPENLPDLTPVSVIFNHAQTARPASTPHRVDDAYIEDTGLPHALLSSKNNTHKPDKTNFNASSTKPTTSTDTPSRPFAPRPDVVDHPWVTPDIPVETGGVGSNGISRDTPLSELYKSFQAFVAQRNQQQQTHSRTYAYGSDSPSADGYTILPSFPTYVPFKMNQNLDTGTRATRFRFKSQKKKPRGSNRDSAHPGTQQEDDKNKNRKKRAHIEEEETFINAKRNERNAKRRRQNALANDDDNEPSSIDPESAFRESLFDALADDEGAAYWEGIYGQPIHIYPRPKRLNPTTGEIEAVNDAEYASHVRQRMWEHTHAGVLEEVAKRKQRHEERMREEREKMAHDEEKRRRAADEERIRREMEQALRRGEARRMTKVYEERFARYTTAWNRWDGRQETIYWPTGSGHRSGVSEKAVRSFFINGCDLKAIGAREFAAKLKEQRVRWHPDKMQQKLGGKDRVTKGVMADITMIFQVIDTLYNDSLMVSK